MTTHPTHPINSVFEEATAEARVQSLPLSHLSLELVTSTSKTSTTVRTAFASTSSRSRRGRTARGPPSPPACRAGPASAPAS